MAIHSSHHPIDTGVHRIVQRAMAALLQEQADDGAWHHAFDMGVMPDAQTAIFLHLLGHADPPWTQALLQRLRGTQRSDGSWGVFPDAPGDVSTTVECYYALSLYAAWQDYEKERTAAEAFIVQKGGLNACRNLTKVVLAIGGEVSWDELPAPVLYAWLWSPVTPVSLWDLVTFTRLHVASMILLSAHRYVSPFALHPILGHLVVRQTRPASTPLRWLHKLATPSVLLRRCARFLCSEREQDGTLAGYHSSTFLFLCATRAFDLVLSTPDCHQTITAIRERSVCPANDDNVIQQTCDAHVWNTALALRTLRAGGLSLDHPAVASSAQYLLNRQHSRQWHTYRKSFLPGGAWGFSHNNTRHPDTDDTAACLEALWGYDALQEADRQAGIAWLLARQNRDGGWSAFDTNCNKRWLEKMPANDMRHAIADPSTPDITARVIELLVSRAGFAPTSTTIDRAVHCLLNMQETDGSWYGRWGTTYLYGTWCAVRALCATGMKGDEAPLVRARVWLLRGMHRDGGYAESCESDVEEHFVDFEQGQPSHTAWALDTLLCLQRVHPEGFEKKRLAHACQRSAAWLVSQYTQQGWRETLPTGSAFPGALHIRYNLYPKVWPLWALIAYQQHLQSD